jgi:hypothetical protein
MRQERHCEQHLQDPQENVHGTISFILGSITLTELAHILAEA